MLVSKIDYPEYSNISTPRQSSQTTYPKLFSPKPSLQVTYPGTLPLSQQLTPPKTLSLSLANNLLYIPCPFALLFLMYFPHILLTLDYLLCQKKKIETPPSFPYTPLSLSKTG
jgi:hypothetical protein